MGNIISGHFNIVNKNKSNTKFKKILLNDYSLTILMCVHSPNCFYDNLLMSALDSLEQQTYKNFNLLIVLDRCWQKTQEKINNFKFSFPYKILAKHKKEGLAVAKNFGLEHIKTELVGFLDVDDLYTPRKLEKQIEYLREYPDVDFLGTYALERLLNPIIIKNHHIPMIYNTHNEIINRLPYENILIHGSMMIKREAIERLQGYRNIKGREDYDLWQRAVLNKFKFYQLPERLYIWTRFTSTER